MEYLPVVKRELNLLTLVVNFGYQEGLITENEKMRIITKSTPDRALLDVLKNAKCDDGAVKLLLALRSIEEMTLDLSPFSDTLKEHYYLSTIMSKLFSKGLVTEEEKLVYENRLEILKDKHEKEVKYSKKQKFEIEELQSLGNNKKSAVNHPMLIHMVINCVLQYLNLEEVKEARYISKVWSSVGLDVLKTRSKISFSQWKDINPDSDYDRTPTNFLSVFPIETLDTVSFTKFRFRDDLHSKSWLIEEVDCFFRNQKKHIKELELDYVKFVKGKGFSAHDHDYSSWLMDSAMTKPNTKYNTAFVIRGPLYWDEGSVRPIPILQLRALVNIKVLKLSDIRVELQDGIFISPTKIEINTVYFHKNGSNLHQVCVNEFVDFSKTKEIVIDYNNHDLGDFNRYDDIDGEDEVTNKATEMILQMTRKDDINLKSLRLSNITLRNISNCNWTVNHLFLKKINFTESTKMNIKEITLHFCQVNISVLPLSTEKLAIRGIKQNNCVCSQPIILHDLNAMTLDFGINSQIIQFLHSRRFKCPNLVELNLTCKSNSLKEVQLIWIPQTLKTLKLTKIYIKDEGVDYNVKLDKLLLCDYYPHEVGEICGTRIQTTNLVLSFRSYCISNRIMAADVANFLNNQNICRGTNHRIYVGEFDWKWENPDETTNIGFHVSPLKGYVDKEANYYAFENQVGKAICSEEFKIAMA